VRLIRLQPPGAICQIQAVCDRLGRHWHGTLLEAGCGAGALLAALCGRGFTGIGIDPSPDAIALAEQTLEPYLRSGRCRLLRTTLEELDPALGPVDVGLSMMTVEHLEDDVGFVRRLAAHVRAGGQVLIGVPGRRDRWSFEDEVVGHLRRYERQDLLRLLRAAGLEQVDVWSVSVPVSNLLFRFGSFLVRRATPPEVLRQTRHEQTAASGIRLVPFKTCFPPASRLVLNPVVLFPLCWLQRRFYRTDLGLILLGWGRVPV
jgi:SAM-dependent methyltransferase